MNKHRTKKKGSISKRLGVQTEKPLTKQKCLRKVKILRQGLSQNAYRGELKRYAVYYANWYAWKASHLKRAA